MRMRRWRRDLRDIYGPVATGLVAQARESIAMLRDVVKEIDSRELMQLKQPL